MEVDKMEGYISINRELERLEMKIKRLADTEPKKKLEKCFEDLRDLCMRADITRFVFLVELRVDVVYSFYSDWVKTCLCMLDELNDIFYFVKENMKGRRKT